MIVIDKIKTIAGTYVENLIGQKFGRLTVLELTDKKKAKHWLWKCKCDCGNICYVLASNLKRGNTKSCGCIFKESVFQNGKNQKEDIADKRFGKLITLYPTEKRIGSSVVWHCICDCGNECDVSAQNLKTGNTKSCGCYSKEVAREKGLNSVKDISGMRFGKLTCIKPTKKRKLRCVIWECRCDCGNICYVDTRSLKSGNTSSCGCLSSKGEQKISKILKKLNISFITQKTFNGCVNNKTNKKLKFDFYLPSYDCCIEYDGKQHFEECGLCDDSLKDRQYRDNIKNEFCKNNDINLLRISYLDYNKIDADYLRKALGQCQKS